MGARAVGLLVGEQKPFGKTPVGGHPSPDMTYLRTCNCYFALCVPAIRVGAPGSCKR